MKKLSLFGLLTTLLIGCGTTSNDTIKSKTEVFGQTSNIKVTDLRSKVVNGLMVVQGTITNTTSNTPQQIYYRCHFYDANKFDLSGGVAWNPITIYGNSSQTVNCMSNSTQATDFRLDVSSSGNAIQVYK